MWFREGEASPGRTARAPRDRSTLRTVYAKVADGRGRTHHKAIALAIVLVAVAGVAWALLAGATAIGDRLFAANPRFVIRHIDVQTTGRLTPAHIREYAGVSDGQNLFASDLDRLRQKLEAVPLIRGAVVRRQLPDRLSIKVTERIAAALIAQPSVRYQLAVDREGYILGPSARSPGLPVLSGTTERGLAPGGRLSDPAVHDAMEAVDFFESARSGQANTIVAIDVGRGENLELQLAGGEQVTLSRDNMKSKIDWLMECLKTEAERGRKIKTINLTVDRNFPVTYVER